ncbi:MAG: 3'-5' exonuclease, partial [Pyrinomonadaceae bacterium]
VFLVGLEQGVFPHIRSLDDENQLEEERRLCYVALTRAKEVLFLTHAKKRHFYLSEVENEPSIFLKEMPDEFLEDLSYSSSWLSAERKKKKQAKIGVPTYDSVEAVAEFFRQKSVRNEMQRTEEIENSPKLNDENLADEIYPGIYVLHEKYGRGLVLKKEGKGEAAKLTVSFPGFGVKKLIEKYAKLKKG